MESSYCHFTFTTTPKRKEVDNMDNYMWINTSTPPKGDLGRDYIYVDTDYVNDTRLNYLDGQIYIYLNVKEQIEHKSFSSIDEIINAIMKDIKHVDEKGWESLQVDVLKPKDIEESLNKLNKLGYIEIL